MSAIVGLFVLPEIFGSIAVILGALAWRNEQSNTGLYVIIGGLICMVVGIEITAVFYLGAFI